MADSFPGDRESFTFRPYLPCCADLTTAWTTEMRTKPGTTTTNTSRAPPVRARGSRPEGSFPVRTTYRPSIARKTAYPTVTVTTIHRSSGQEIGEARPT